MDRNKSKIIGRISEQKVLQSALESDEAEMVAVVGRRRVGKTFLVKNTYQKHIVFEASGLQNAGLSEQLQNFGFQINRQLYDGEQVVAPFNWLDAFQQLILALEKKIRRKKRTKSVIFFDELPWFDTQKSGFLRALGFFWNSWCADRPIVVVICGSAASWMIEKVVNDKGGLHNRITRRLDLAPFSLFETEKYLQSRQIRLSRYQILQLYMVFGGVPHYLKEIESGKSAMENIGRICFSPTGNLVNEFQNLYPALFDNAAHHSAVIRALSEKWKGLTRTELIQETGLSDGGSFSRVLDELVFSGFISSFQPFGKGTRDVLYRLTDEYSLFYLHFVEKQPNLGMEWWLTLSQTAPYKIWCGYAFENVCLKHVAQIKKALGISGVYVEASSFYSAGQKQNPGLQIDLVLDRKDQTINLIEIKYYNTEVVLGQQDALALRGRVERFRTITKTHKHLFLSFLTTFGVKSNEHSVGLLDHNLTLDLLFEP